MNIKKRVALSLFTAIATLSLPILADAVASAEVIGGITQSPEVAAARWNEIKDLTFDKRDNFFAGLNKILEIVDAQVSDLNEKRRLKATNNGTVDWDLAITELITARDYIKSLSREAKASKEEEWSQTKERISQAWAQTQSAYDKARVSTPK